VKGSHQGGSVIGLIAVSLSLDGIYYFNPVLAAIRSRPMITYGRALHLCVPNSLPLDELPNATISAQEG